MTTVTTCSINFSCGKGYVAKESDTVCANNPCKASDCCLETCQVFKCPEDKEVSSGTACETESGCNAAICCVTPPKGNAAAQGARAATHKLCETALHSLPPGTSPQYNQFLQAGCQSLLDVGALPVIEVSSGIANMGIGMFNGLMRHSLNTILQLAAPAIMEMGIEWIKEDILSLMTADPVLQKSLMKAAEKDVEEGIVSGAASRAGLGLAMARATVAGKLGDKALAEGAEFVTISTAKGIMWNSMKGLADFIPGMGQLMMLGMFIDMMDPCDINSAMTGAQLQTMVNQMDASFRNTILEAKESIPTSQNISVPFDEFPLTIDAFDDLQEVANMMTLEKTQFGEKDGGGETGDIQQLYMAKLYHRYVSLYLHNLQVNANNEPITWATDVPATVPMSRAKTRLYTAFMTLTNNNLRAADLGVKYWYLILVFVLSFVGAVVLFLLS